MHNLSSIGLVLAASLTVLVVILAPAAADYSEPKDFDEVLSLSKRLESASFALHKATDQQRQDRGHLVYQFVRATKSPYCDKKFDETLQVASEYKIKAYELMRESKKSNKGWFSNVLGNTFGPISKLRGLSKSDVYLDNVTKRYETASKNGLLTEQTIDCDINKFKIKALHEIMLVLQSEVKYVINEPGYVINRAIYDKLKADQFVSASNFYVSRELNDAQRQLLLNFLASRKDLSRMTIGQAVDHYYNPGEFVVGRLLETCQVLTQFNENLKQNSDENGKLCKDDGLDPLGPLFKGQFQPERFSETFNFCDHLLGAL